MTYFVNLQPWTDYQNAELGEGWPEEASKPSQSWYYPVATG